MRHLSNLRQLVGNKFTALAMATLAFVTGSQAVVIPDTGADVSGYITAAITAMGAVIAVVIGGYFAFLIIRKALKWAGRALG